MKFYWLKKQSDYQDYNLKQITKQKLRKSHKHNQKNSWDNQTQFIFKLQPHTMVHGSRTITITNMCQSKDNMLWFMVTRCSTKQLRFLTKLFWNYDSQNHNRQSSDQFQFTCTAKWQTSISKLSTQCNSIRKYLTHQYILAMHQLFTNLQKTHVIKLKFKQLTKIPSQDSSKVHLRLRSVLS